MHRFWLDLTVGDHGDFQGTARWLLDYSADLCISIANSGDPDDLEITRAAGIAKEIAARPADSSVPADRPDLPLYAILVTDEELEDVKAVLQYAAEYWSACDYANTGDSSEEILAGTLAIKHVSDGMSFIWSDIFGSHDERFAKS